MDTLFSDHADAALIALCTRLETLQRRLNGLWLQGVGTRYYAPGSYIEDDDAREIACEILGERIDELFDQIVEQPVTTIDGVRAVARCMVLSEPDLRQDPETTIDGVQFSYRGAYVMHRFLCSQAGSGITPATCMDAPGLIRSDEVAL